MEPPKPLACRAASASPVLWKSLAVVYLTSLFRGLMIWLLPCSELLHSLKDAAVSQDADSLRALRAVSPPGEPSHLQTPSEAMRASGDLVEIAACLGRNEQCVNRFEVSRVVQTSGIWGNGVRNGDMCSQTGLCLTSPGEERMTVDTEFEQR